MLLAQKMICGPPTLQRMTVARLALSFSAQNKAIRYHSIFKSFLHKVMFFCFRVEDYSSLILNFRRISILSRIQENISKICDASFLFWHRVIGIHQNQRVIIQRAD